MKYGSNDTKDSPTFLNCGYPISHNSARLKLESERSRLSIRLNDTLNESERQSFHLAMHLLQSAMIG